MLPSARHLPSARPSKGQLAAMVAARLGVLRAVRTARTNRGLVVLAYHRVGNPAECRVDHGLMTVSRQELTTHARLLQRTSRVVTLVEVEERAQTGRGFDEPLSLLTFDDAYRDNFQEALPALQAAEATAVFFVATGLIETGVIPWWDRLAYAVKHSTVDTAQLPYPGDLVLSEIRSAPQAALRGLLRRYKSDAALDKQRFLGAVEQALGASAAQVSALHNQFCTWDELRMLRSAGMDLAAHTHSHELLSHLSLAGQREELGRCKELLRNRLGVEARSLAFPVGSRTAFNADTRRALQECGYRAAFSHYGGWNRGSVDPFNLLRVPVDEFATPHVIHAAASLPAVFAG